MWNRIIVYGCLTFPVNLQWFQVLVPCWAATNACLLTHGILRDYRNTLLETNFLRSIPDIILKEFSLAHHKENEDQFHKLQGQVKPFSQEMTNKREVQFQCRHLRRIRRLWVLLYLWNYRRATWSDSKDSKFWSFNSTNSLILNHSWFGKYDSKMKWLPVLIFHRMLCCGSRKWRWLKQEEFEVLAIRFWKAFSKFSRYCTRRLLLFWNKIFQKSQLKKKVSLVEQKAQKEDRCLRGRQIAFMIYDYFRMTGAHDTVLDADLFSVTLHDDNIQEFDTRWDEVLLSVTKFHPMIPWKVCTIWEYVSPRNWKQYWNCTTWRFIRRCRFRTFESWKPWWRGWWRGVSIRNLGCETFDAGHWRIESGAVVNNRKGLIGVEGGKGTRYEESRRKQVRLQDEMALRERESTSR